MHHLTCGINSLLHSVYLIHSPPGSPHPAHITYHSHHLCSRHLSLPLPSTPDLKLISFTNPSSKVTLIPSGLPSRILTCTEIKGNWPFFVLVSF